MGNDVIRMQQEAEQRVARMREHSRMLVNGGLPERGRSQETMAAVRPAPYTRRTFPVPAPTPPPPPSRPVPPPAEKAPEDCKELAKTGGLFEDQEQLLLLLLAVLLVKNGAPIELIVALLYLAM